MIFWIFERTNWQNDLRLANKKRFPAFIQSFSGAKHIAREHKSLCVINKSCHCCPCHIEKMSTMVWQHSPSPLKLIFLLKWKFFMVSYDLSQAVRREIPHWQQNPPEHKHDGAYLLPVRCTIPLVTLLLSHRSQTFRHVYFVNILCDSAIKIRVRLQNAPGLKCHCNHRPCVLCATLLQPNEMCWNSTNGRITINIVDILAFVVRVCFAHQIYVSTLRECVVNHREQNMDEAQCTHVHDRFVAAIPVSECKEHTYETNTHLRASQCSAQWGYTLVSSDSGRHFVYSHERSKSFNGHVGVGEKLFRFVSLILCIFLIRLFVSSRNALTMCSWTAVSR